MKKIFNKEFKIGLVTILCGLILFFGIDYLKGINIFKPDNYYFINYKNVSGLAVSGPVVIDGFKVGLISSIEYDYTHPGNVIVEVSLDKKLKIPAGSKAVIVSGLLGDATVELKLNQYVGKTISIGDTLQGEFDAGMLGTVSEKLLPQLETMLPRIDSILSGLDLIVNHSGLQQTFLNVNALTGELEKSSRSLTQMMNKDMPVIITNLKTMSTNFSDISENLKEIDLQKTINSVNQTLDNVELLTSKLNSKDNSMGLLLNSDQLYMQLSHTVSSADSLMVDLKRNPKRYVHFSVFGKK